MGSASQTLPLPAGFTVDPEQIRRIGSTQPRPRRPVVLIPSWFQDIPDGWRPFVRHYPAPRSEPMAPATNAAVANPPGIPEKVATAAPAPKTLREQIALVGGRDPKLPPGWVRHVAHVRPRTTYQQAIEDRRRARLRLKRTRLRRARRENRRY